MTFLWIHMLWLLLLVPVLVWLYFFLQARKKKAALKYANLRIIKEAVGKGAGVRRHFPPALFLLAVITLLLSTARPAAVVSLPSRRGTVILAMDISGSMRARDIPPSRIAVSQEAARAFIAEQPRSVRIGIVAFAGTSSVVQPPTTDRKSILSSIDRFRTQRGTAIGSGILSSLEVIFEHEGLQLDVPGLGNGPGGRSLDAPAEPQQQERAPVAPGSYSSAIIILLTDGRATQGPDPLEAAATAADLGVRVFTVGFGTVEGEVLGLEGWSMRVQLDEPTLKAIADRTGGRYFHASSESDLKDVYKLLTTEFIMETENVEITALFAAAGAILALVSVFLSVLWWNRIA